ncbi:hypothetical protein BGZ60DRAFT_394513 [Tricladium varicosporioides]|nr:hypothetical protein BGZ60DRAFT_394513 [Hymenoscyphus varicosporioides]
MHRHKSTRILSISRLSSLCCSVSANQIHPTREIIPNYPLLAHIITAFIWPLSFPRFLTAAAIFARDSRASTQTHPSVANMLILALIIFSRPSRRTLGPPTNLKTWSARSEPTFGIAP